MTECYEHSQVVLLLVGGHEASECASEGALRHVRVWMSCHFPPFSGPFSPIFVIVCINVYYVVLRCNKSVFKCNSTQLVLVCISLNTALIHINTEKVH